MYFLLYLSIIFMAVIASVTAPNANHVIKKRWDWHDEGSLFWAERCDFYDSDMSQAKIQGEQCGPTCESTPGCTHFTWNGYDGGTCFMKQGGTSLDKAVAYAYDYSVCGMLKTSQGPQNSGTAVGNVPGTRWADATDGGGCQMPAGDYVIQNALALGQSSTLGSLAWHNGLCGQVLRVNCGGGTVEAVVASTCNIGSDSCGVDLITPTWNLATGNQPPGEAKCSVELSTTNPLSDSGPVCYFRPDSDHSPYYASMGVFNVAGRVVDSAVSAGVKGAFQSGSGWFDFNSNGQALFNDDATVQFSFNDGSSNTFKINECRSGGRTHIWS